MIAHVRGNLIHKSTESVVVDVGGVGYEVFIPLSTFYKLPELNGPVTLKVHTHLKDDAIQLWGFLTIEEKDAFQLLISVSGVGPRLARNILSGIPVADLISSIATSDRARLSSIPGIGAKSAERLILELKDKAASLVRADTASIEPPAKDQLSRDVVSALENLGYKNAAAAEAVKKARANLSAGAQGAGVAEVAGGVGFEVLFKDALKALSKK